MTANHHIQIRTDFGSLDGERFSDAVETALFRICQESINNIIKHSGATEAIVHLAKRQHSLVLDIQDNGRGIDLNRIDSDGSQLGLLGVLRERAALLGGTFQIDSGIGQGTRITVTVPADAPR